MKSLKHIADYYKKMGIGSEAHMNKALEVLDTKVMMPLEESNPELFWDIRRDIHKIYMGSHYNEEFAKWQVEHMYHMEGGDKKQGQHWSMSDAEKVYSKYKPIMKAKDNISDVYVALNSMYHDLYVMYKSWFADNYEERIIEAAISYFFKDEDAPEGKIWRYYEAMREYKTTT